MGKYNKYKMEDIKVDDEVYFDSTHLQHNFDKYWKVTGFPSKTSISLYLDEYNGPHYWTVEVSEIRSVIPGNNM